MSDDEFLDYLRETLIPDLLASGSAETAKDFARCVQLIDKLRRQARKAAKPRDATAAKRR